MGNGKRYAKFQENLFSGNEIKSIFCPPLFRKQPIFHPCNVSHLNAELHQDFMSHGRTHGTPYCTHGYIPLVGGDVIMRMGT